MKDGVRRRSVWRRERELSREWAGGVPTLRVQCFTEVDRYMDSAEVGESVELRGAGVIPGVGSV